MSLEDIHSRNIDPDNRRIYLHGDALVKDEEPGVDYRMANMFIKNMDFLSSTPGDITICMGTVGGDWNYGMAIYDRIRACANNTTVIGYAWARSMSSIILQAANYRMLTPNADFMVHYGDSAYNGHYLAVQSGAKHEKRSETTMLRIYAERCRHGEFFKNWPVEQIMEYIDKQIKEKSDWWLSADEAVYYGFCDEVVGLP